jgi:hypothetical protein
MTRILAKIVKTILENLTPSVKKSEWKKAVAPIHEEEIASLLFSTSIQTGPLLTIHKLFSKIFLDWKKID